MRDRVSIRLRVAWHRDCALKVGDLRDEHLHSTHFLRSLTQEMRAKLVSEVAHDRVGLSQLNLTIDEVGQVREAKAQRLLDVLPLTTIEIRRVTLLILVLHELHPKIGHFVADLRCQSPNLPVAQPYWRLILVHRQILHKLQRLFLFCHVYMLKK